MTCIAFDGISIATDSRYVRGDGEITSDAKGKCINRDGYKFFVAGNWSDAEALIDAWLNKVSKVEKSNDADLFAMKDGAVQRIGSAEGVVYTEKAKAPDALGTGKPHALTAMDMGADAKTAVKMAAKRDTNTGGRIHVYKVAK
jgi:hypothetical protein